MKNIIQLTGGKKRGGYHFTQETISNMMAIVSIKTGVAQLYNIIGSYENNMILVYIVLILNITFLLFNDMRYIL